MTVSATNLIGRRAVYTQVHRRWDEVQKTYAETSRVLFHGEIVAFCTTGEEHYPTVVMLYDSGALLSHSISNVTIEAAQAEGPFR